MHKAAASLYLLPLFPSYPSQLRITLLSVAISSLASPSSRYLGFSSALVFSPYLSASACLLCLWAIEVIHYFRTIYFHTGLPSLISPHPFSYVFFLPLFPRLWLSALPSSWSLLHCSAEAMPNQSQDGSMAGVHGCKEKDGGYTTKINDHTGSNDSKKSKMWKTRKVKAAYWERSKEKWWLLWCENLWSSGCRTLQQELDIISLCHLLFK